MKTLLAALLLLSLGSLAQTPAISIVADPNPGIATKHGLTALTNALATQKISFEQVASLDESHGATIIVTGPATGQGNAAKLVAPGKPVAAVPEALTIRKATWKNKPVWIAAGSDDRGQMYALLEMANRIGWPANNRTPLAGLSEVTEQPAVTERALSVYTMNRAYWESRIYNEDYWAKYLDMLAMNRFNTLVVIFGYENGGFLAPSYPYFFNVDGYPEVKMVGITAEQQAKNLKAFNRLIDMAHERGIRFSVGIWDHIYRGGVQGGGIPGTKEAPDQPVPGLVWGLNADNLTAYTKKALAQFIREVPHLDAIQFRMHDESGLKNGEQDAFWADVFRAMKETAPNLRLDLRAKELKESVIQSAINTGVDFRIETKYWMEQMGMPYHPTQINPEKSARRHTYSDMLRYPKQYKMHWRLWNGGTSRILLWGDPEYVRRFAESTHLYDGDGYEVNEPLATKMEAQPHDAKPFELMNAPYRFYTYEFERYWHFFQVFGRIGYNPNTDAATWDREFQQRFGTTAGPLLEAALHKASWILPRIITSSYPYTSFPMTRGWAEKQRLGDLPTFAKADFSDLSQFASFDNEAQQLLEGGASARILPSTNSRWFEETATAINSLLARAEKAGGKVENKELITTTTDLHILANLALYHARRIPAAVNYRLFERTQDPRALEAAIRCESAAIDAWRQLVKSAGDVYTSDLMMGVRVADLCGHWRDELVLLEKGLQALEAKKAAANQTPSTKTPVLYKPAALADNGSLFTISHERMDSVILGQPITIKIGIKNPAGIRSVRLRYRNVNQEQAYEVMDMPLINGSYQATVPAAQINPRWDFMYFIEIIDNKDRGMIFPNLNQETPYRVVRFTGR